PASRRSLGRRPARDVERRRRLTFGPLSSALEVNAEPLNGLGNQYTDRLRALWWISGSQVSALPSPAAPAHLPLRPRLPEWLSGNLAVRGTVEDRCIPSTARFPWPALGIARPGA